MAFPKKPIDWEIFEKLCVLHCTHQELADFFHVAKCTLYDRAKKHYGADSFMDVYNRYAADGKISLRRHQLQLAKTNATMAIWMGKQILGQKDYQELSSDATAKIEVVHYGEKQPERWSDPTQDSAF